MQNCSTWKGGLVLIMMLAQALGKWDYSMCGTIQKAIEQTLICYITLLSLQLNSKRNLVINATRQDFCIYVYIGSLWRSYRPVVAILLVQQRDGQSFTHIGVNVSILCKMKIFAPLNNDSLVALLYTLRILYNIAISKRLIHS